uniref:ATP-binding protein n=1 Tax=uncultured Bradyrhizobium sp. TaxID=199684 RepID=UPI00261C192B
PSTDVEELAEYAKDFNYPIFVKAVAGGGGRGMRFIENEAELKTKCAEASREAEAAFGDGHVYLETAVIRPQHIEVQILGDSQGNVMHLYERDCSVQRRHQKVVEIAPAPTLDPELRDRICADAVKFCEHINYEGAGTVEFLVDGRVLRRVRAELPREDVAAAGYGDGRAGFFAELKGDAAQKIFADEGESLHGDDAVRSLAASLRRPSSRP